MILSILMTDNELAFFILILTMMISAVAFMVGYAIAEIKEGNRVKQYCTDHSMNLTGELLRDLYPVDFVYVSFLQTKKRNENSI
jgi:hypothetical protein